MRAGLVGLGRMGRALAAHAVERGHHIVAYDRDAAAARAASGEGIETAASPEQLVAGLSTPRTVLLYVPHGPATTEVCRLLARLLNRGDLVADGGNSDWRDSVRRHAEFGQRGIRFLDVGTSGGIEGARRGAAFMVGGAREAFEAIRPLLEDLAVDPEAVIFAGPPGAGHFVKLVHNAIEFGMIQAIAEGVELLQQADYPLDIPALLASWGHGSVIRSWLLALMARALREVPDFDALSTFVEDTGEVKWVLDWSLERDIPLPVVSAAQTALMMYRDRTSPAARAVALLRHAFGGHPVHGRDADGARGADRA